MKRIEAIGFDMDSTLVMEEGLNWLADLKGRGPEVEKLTRDSMNGLISVAEVMPLKVDEIIRPSRNDMNLLAERYLSRISPNAFDVVRELQKAGKHVVIITGNFHQAVDPIAKSLGIALADVYANSLEFEDDGSYKRFIENYHLMHDDGKQQVVHSLRQRFGRIFHVGDSMGDALAGADIFIGYGGVEIRRKVLERANNYIPGESLAPVLSVALSNRQLRRVRDKELVQRATAGLLVKQENVRK